jgi:UDP-N-acetylmuramoylalanine--D-glutamate ligase
MSNYVKAKFRLLKNQPKHGIAFVKKNDVLIEKQLNLIKSKKKIIKVNCNKNFKFLQKIDNNYFSTDTNMENLKFVLEISKKLNLKIKPLIQSINNFKGLKYRQQIIYKKRNLTIINDSKSTSFASSISILKTNQNIFWILGGIYKKGDKFKLPKKYYNKIRAFIFGKKTNFFKKELKGKITYECFHNLNEALKRIFTILKRQKKNQNILFFSPSAASFDNFKNFEDRGLYFNDLIKKYLNGKKKNII